MAGADVDDATVRERTGRGWDEWVALIDAGPGRIDSPDPATRPRRESCRIAHR